MAIHTTGTAVEAFMDTYCSNCIHTDLFDGDTMSCPVVECCLYGMPEEGTWEKCKDLTDVMEFIDSLFFDEEKQCRMFVKKT